MAEQNAAALTRKEFFLLNALHVLIDGLYDSVPLLLAFIVLSFGAGEQAIGMIVSAAVMASTAAGLCTVYFSSRFALLQSTALVVLLYGTGFFLCSFSPWLFFAGVCFFVAITGHSVFHNTAFAWLTEHTERRLLGKTMSDFTAIGDIGRVPLVTFAGFAAALSFGGVEGWRLVCALYGGVTLVCALWLAWYAFMRKRDMNARHTRKTGRILPSFQLLKGRRVRLSILASALNALSCDCIFVFLPLLLLAKGFDPKSIGGFAFGFTLGCCIGKMLCGRLIDRFGNKAVFIVAQIVLAALLALLVSDIGLLTVVVVALLIGVVTKGSVPIIQTIITEYVPDRSQYSDIFAINTFCRGGISMAMPLAFGFIAQSFGIHSIYMIMLAGALVSLIPVVLLGRGGRTG